MCATTTRLPTPTGMASTTTRGTTKGTTKGTTMNIRMITIADSSPLATTYLFLMTMGMNATSRAQAHAGACAQRHTRTRPHTYVCDTCLVSGADTGMGTTTRCTAKTTPGVQRSIITASSLTAARTRRSAPSDIRTRVTTSRALWTQTSWPCLNTTAAQRFVCCCACSCVCLA